MLIIFENHVINLKAATDFFLQKEEIKFYFSFLRDQEYASSIISFETVELAKKAFERIIYAYANEYRTLDLSQYATD